MKTVVPLVALSVAWILSFSGEAIARPGFHRLHQRESTPATVCTASTDNIITAPKPNIWHELSADEIQGATKFMLERKELNLTDASNATISDNFVSYVELFPVKKCDATSFFDANGTKPERYARISVNYGGLDAPIVKIYKVGPIPIGNLTKYTKIGTVPFEARFTNFVTDLTLWNVVTAKFVGKPLADAGLSQDLFGGVYYNDVNDTLSWAGLPASFDGTVRTVTQYWSDTLGDDYYIRQVGLFSEIDVTGTDPNQWKLNYVFYEGSLFHTTDEFITAWKSKKLKIPHKYAFNGDLWSKMEPAGPYRPFDNISAPRLAEFGSKRYAIDPQQRYIEWMGWEFYVGFIPDTGLAFYDVRFKGERIAYEIALQEALASYCGDDPVSSTTNYLDRHYRIGRGSDTLVPGYDCPATATFFNTTADSGKTVQNNICAFEADSGLPVGRHRSSGATSTKGMQFYVRSIATMGNYDYTFDYIFWLDGTIEIKMSASGYMQGTWWTKDNEEFYGGRISEYSMGSLHDHILNYKIDLDILGEKNDLLTVNIVTENVEKPWLRPGETLVQKKYVRKTVTTENDSFFSTEKGSPDFTTVLVANKNRTNKWGNPRAYRVVAQTPVTNPVKGNTRTLNNANWAYYPIAVTQFSDDEHSSSSLYNQNTPTNPIVDFHKFQKGRSLIGEDLVVWANLGTHHVPRAEDGPITLTSLARGSILITPFNYFDEYAIRDVRDAAYIVNGNASLGQAPESCNARTFTFPGYK
ncbi:amine oxidase catalytic domain-containing protein [Gonapodya prolifera JEL478]|uniref:Amine oxidase n=1 Tax=Gonapodya prolifera (strain JEL478) TaxID=1344416 RepID=A0A139B190_GONPJ|nr:amine oxidase catalytic domain-containing protein [Gonapodya prolifera JEL478]|eukprot:KXS22495.1 amine oxidase catalytic domain-containing protein [Gonapodya prolifera JEL478]